MAVAHDYLRLGIGKHQDAEAAFVLAGMHGDVRCVDLDVGFAVLEDRKVHQALRDLDLNLLIAEGGDVGLRVLVEAKNVGEIELNFGLGVGAGGDFIAGFERLIDGRGGPIAGIAALR